MTEPKLTCLREEFEEWAKGPKLPLERDRILYAEYMTQLAWSAWQAALLRPQAVPPADREIAEKAAREILNFLTAIDWSASSATWKNERVVEFVERAITESQAPALPVEESLRAHLNWGDKPLRPWQENVVFVVQAREALAREAAQRKLDEVEKALSGLLAVTEKRGDAAKFLAVGKAEAALDSLRAD